MVVSVCLGWKFQSAEFSHTDDGVRSRIRFDRKWAIWPAWAIRGVLSPTTKESRGLSPKIFQILEPKNRDFQVFDSTSVKKWKIIRKICFKFSLLFYPNSPYYTQTVFMKHRRPTPPLKSKCKRSVFLKKDVESTMYIPFSVGSVETHNRFNSAELSIILTTRDGYLENRSWSDAYTKFSHTCLPSILWLSQISTNVMTSAHGIAVTVGQ